MEIHAAPVSAGACRQAAISAADGHMVDVLGNQERDDEGDHDDPGEQLDVTRLAQAEADQHIGDEAQADADRDLIGQWDANDRHKGGNTLERIVEIDVAHDVHHQEAHHDQCTAGGRRGNHTDER